MRQKDLEDFVVEVAASNLQGQRRYRDMAKSEAADAEVLFIADYLKRNTRRLDRSIHALTFSDLQRILSRFSVTLENPIGNYIDVVRYDPPNAIARVFGRTESVKYIRELLGLTLKNGVDSASFYGGADPLNVLISEYAGPLKRLADR